MAEITSCKIIVSVFIIFTLFSCNFSFGLKLGEKCGPTDNDELTTTPSFFEDECSSNEHLECVDGYCNCVSGYTVGRNGSCLEIATRGSDSPCCENIQCWKGLMGRLSECNETAGRCQCYHSETIPIVLHQGRCLYGESLGDFCGMDGLCSRSVPNASCRNGSCQCNAGFVGSWDKSRCLPIATKGLHSSCEENIQCEQGSLGTLSECNQTTMKCQCYRIPMVLTVLYRGRCYFGASLGDVCQVDAQCAAMTEHSVCTAGGKCGCLPPYYAAFNGTRCISSIILNKESPLLTRVASDSQTKSLLKEGQCTSDDDCQNSPMGRYSVCNEFTGACECGNLEGEKTIFVDNVCHPVQKLGNRCLIHEQCNVKTPDAICYKGECTCPSDTHVKSSDNRKCLKIPTKTKDSR